MPELSVCDAGLPALRSVDAVKSDALTRNFERVAVDDTRLPGDIGEGEGLSQRRCSGCGCSPFTFERILCPPPLICSGGQLGQHHTAGFHDTRHV